MSSIQKQEQTAVTFETVYDKDFNFEDLAGAIRKCRTDFGVEIEIEDLDGLRHKKPNNRYCEKHYARGTIDYGSLLQGQNRDTHFTETILTERGLPADVQNYADMDTCFPQQPTADQWSDEAQFESYRKLGYHVVQSLFADDTFDKKAHGLM